MRISRLWIPISIVCLVFATTGLAQAHVSVSPEEAPAGSYEKFTVSAPNEKEIPTTEIRVEIPDGLTVSDVQPVPGWEYEFEKEGGLITAITWSGGEIQSREFQEFAFQAQTPEEPGSLTVGAIQTYEDGSVVEWTGPPDAEEPASVVEVVAGESGEHGAETEEASSGETPESPEAQASGSDLPGTGGVSVALVYGGMGAGAVALLVGLAALWRRNVS